MTSFWPHNDETSKYPYIWDWKSSLRFQVKASGVKRGRCGFCPPPAWASFWNPSMNRVKGPIILQNCPILSPSEPDQLIQVIRRIWAPFDWPIFTLRNLTCLKSGVSHFSAISLSGNRRCPTLFYDSFGTNHLIFIGGGGGGDQKMTKNCLQEAKAGKKLFANSLSEQNLFAWQF